MLDRRRIPGAAVSAGAALLLLAWVAQSQQEPLQTASFTQPEFVGTRCPMLWLDRTRPVQVDCGYVSVLEDRGRPDGNVLKLAVARLRGSLRSPHPDPVIYLAGGPGDSALEQTARFIHDARFIWEERDLILLDQRGVGHSEPRLECPDYRRKRLEVRELVLDPDEALQREVEAMLACKRTLSEQGIDVWEDAYTPEAVAADVVEVAEAMGYEVVDAYTPEAVAADVVEVAEAMGYEVYNLYGTGFGSNVALGIMRDFPGNVRAVILDGVWPQQVNATEARHANAASALKAFFGHCEADPECSGRHPDLEQKFWQVFDRYEDHPTTAEYFDYYLDEPFKEDVDGHFVLHKVLQSLRSDPWIPYLPFLLDRIASGDHRVAWVFNRHRFERASIDNSAAWAALLCHADGRFDDRARVLADRAAHPRIADPEARDPVPVLCAAWHDPALEPIDRTPVASDIPALLLSGEFDPTTPPRWADLAAETLSRSHSLVVPMAGHGVGMDTPCGLALVAAFLNVPGDDPSPACFPTAAQKNTGFRTIHLNDAVRGPALRMLGFETMGSVLLLAVLLVVVLHVSALIVWPVAAVIRRVRSSADSVSHSVGHPWMTAAAVIALGTAFSWSVGAAQHMLFGFMALVPQPRPSWLVRMWWSVINAWHELQWFTDGMVRNFGYYSWVRPLFVIPYLTAAAIVYVLYLARRSWRDRWWNGLGRMHYSIVAITLLWYPIHLVYLGLIP